VRDHIWHVLFFDMLRGSILYW